MAWLSPTGDVPYDPCASGSRTASMATDEVPLLWILARQNDVESQTDTYIEATCLAAVESPVRHLLWQSKSQGVLRRQYGTDYVAAEEAARAARRGLWSGSFETPSDWRKERRIEQLQQSLTRDRKQRAAHGGTDRLEDVQFGWNSEPLAEQNCSSTETTTLGAKLSALCRRLLGGGNNANTATGSKPTQDSSGTAADAVVAALGVRNLPPAPDCVIKGNISSNSRSKIYHVPGGAAYEKTQIDLSAGERWFCTEEEAQAAGWRKAKS